MGTERHGRRRPGDVVEEAICGAVRAVERDLVHGAAPAASAPKRSAFASPVSSATRLLCHAAWPSKYGVRFPFPRRRPVVGQAVWCQSEPAPRARRRGSRRRRSPGRRPWSRRAGRNAALAPRCSRRRTVVGAAVVGAAVVGAGVVFDVGAGVGQARRSHGML